MFVALGGATTLVALALSVMGNPVHMSPEEADRGVWMFRASVCLPALGVAGLGVHLIRGGLRRHRNDLES